MAKLKALIAREKAEGAAAAGKDSLDDVGPKKKGKKKSKSRKNFD